MNLSTVEENIALDCGHINIDESTCGSKVNLRGEGRQNENSDNQMSRLKFKNVPLKRQMIPKRSS